MDKNCLDIYKFILNREMCWYPVCNCEKIIKNLKLIIYKKWAIDDLFLDGIISYLINNFLDINSKHQLNDTNEKIKKKRERIATHYKDSKAILSEFDDLISDL